MHLSPSLPSSLTHSLTRAYKRLRTNTHAPACTHTCTHTHKPMLVHLGDGLWASKAKLLAAVHTTRAQSDEADDIAESEWKAAYTSKIFGFWRYMAVSEKKLRENERAQAVLLQQFDKLQAEYDTQTLALRELERQTTHLGSLVEVNPFPPPSLGLSGQRPRGLLWQ